METRLQCPLINWGVACKPRLTSFIDNERVVHVIRNYYITGLTLHTRGVQNCVIFRYLNYFLKMFYRVYL